jgi:hypothetical protein
LITSSRSLSRIYIPTDNPFLVVKRKDANIININGYSCSNKAFSSSSDVCGDVDEENGDVGGERLDVVKDLQQVDFKN